MNSPGNSCLLRILILPALAICEPSWFDVTFSLQPLWLPPTSIPALIIQQLYTHYTLPALKSMVTEFLQNRGLLNPAKAPLELGFGLTYQRECIWPLDEQDEPMAAPQHTGSS